MYIPHHYRQTDFASIVSFMQQFSFGTIVTAGEGRPEATHLPFGVALRHEELVLTSHFARANAQWQQLAASEVLVIFSEPHAYVSPSHYEHLQNVPTWNYMAVHAYGRARLLTEPAEVMALLEATIVQYEPAYLAQWKALPETYRTRMAKGIVGFEVVVQDLQAKEKLSQNRSAPEQAAIAQSLAASPHGSEQLLAGFMRQRAATVPAPE